VESACLSVIFVIMPPTPVLVSCDTGKVLVMCMGAGTKSLVLGTVHMLDTIQYNVIFSIFFILCSSFGICNFGFLAVF
jgi:hypothetical protein